MIKLLKCEGKFYIKFIIGLIIMNVVIQLIGLVVPIKEYATGAIISSFVVFVLVMIGSFIKIVIYLFKSENREDFDCSDLSLLRRVGNWLGGI